jgi:hypothetical protein
MLRAAAASFCNLLKKDAEQTARPKQTRAVNQLPAQKHQSTARRLTGNKEAARVINAG